MSGRSEELRSGAIKDEDLRESLAAPSTDSSMAGRSTEPWSGTITEEDLLRL